MEYRRLGRTEEYVSTMGMGTWKIGVYSGPSERATQVQALKRGIELGCNLIDTAEMYAGGRSEEVVGEAIEDLRKDVFIASKVSPNNLHHDDVIAACNKSLKRLRTRYIDLYQIHWPNSTIPIKETMSAMEALVREGKVRYIGVSNFSVEQTEEARAALPKSELVSNQVEYSLTNRSSETQVLPYCEKNGLTLIAYSPLAKGTLPEWLIPKAICAKYKVTPVQVMLNWVTRSKSVVAIPKSANIRHVEENMSSVAVQFSDEEYGLIGRN